jgi:cation transporter-like permease
MFGARMHALWERSDFGVHATCAGILLLGAALLLNRLVPIIRYDPDDLVIPTVLWGYVAVHWLMLLVGGALVLVGTWRIFMIDMR